jgi:ketosteroid isomerase-like protein
MQEEETIVRMAFDAFQRKDRTLIESLLADDFHFTSPYDDHIHRDDFFDHCWPGSEKMKAINILSIGVTGDEVLAHYEVEMNDGSHFKNVDTFIIQDGMIISQEAYFGDPPRGMSRSDFAFLSSGGAASSF